MSGHTPGPWEAEVLALDARPNERPWIGRLGERKYVALSCADTQEEGVANARLIAAAPDLLEALQELLSATREVGYVHYAPLRSKAEAAIARATGASS